MEIFYSSKGILPALAEFLDFKDLNSLSQTCKLFQQVKHIKYVYNVSGLSLNLSIKFRFVKVLYLPGNQITDLSCFLKKSGANLTNLTELYLWNNQITDLSPLANLTKLTELYLYKNQITDLSPLANLKNCKYD
jgi:internalin A